ncbi:MAG TPA: flagellar basal body L-ring protein FlgH [Oligoflexia bacterium]|nr:flagellar basal body L-ring protein FlgH [Oligoflexia bacterium]
MNTASTTLLLLLIATLSGCGWVRSLRSEVEDEADTSRAPASDFDYRDPANRMLPPPPLNARDSREAPISGTPVDLAGIRAKSGRVTKQNFIDESMRNENSLWNDDGQSNYLFARNKLKAPGDLVTIVIEDQLRSDMVREVKKILPPEYRDQEIRVPGLTKEVAAAAPDDATRAPAATNSGELSHEDLMTAEVLERYQNGNIRIRGVKRIPFKRSVRNIEVVAIVRGNEISEVDQIKSSRFFEHRVELYR